MDSTVFWVCALLLLCNWLACILYGLFSIYFGDASCLCRCIFCMFRWTLTSAKHVFHFFVKNNVLRTHPPSQMVYNYVLLWCYLLLMHLLLYEFLIDSRFKKTICYSVIDPDTCGDNVTSAFKQLRCIRNAAILIYGLHSLDWVRSVYPVCCLHCHHIMCLIGYPYHHYMSWWW